MTAMGMAVTSILFARRRGGRSLTGGIVEQDRARQRELRSVGGSQRLRVASETPVHRGNRHPRARAARHLRPRIEQGIAVLRSEEVHVDGRRRKHTRGRGFAVTMVRSSTLAGSTQRRRRPNRRQSAAPLS